MSAIVGDFRKLKAMERRGFIKLHGGPKSRERHWTGYGVRILHVAAGPKLANWFDQFEYKGEKYRLRYFDGCFHPFVVRCGVELPSFV